MLRLGTSECVVTTGPGCKFITLEMGTSESVVTTVSGCVSGACAVWGLTLVDFRQVGRRWGEGVRLGTCSELFSSCIEMEYRGGDY